MKIFSKSAFSKQNYNEHFFPLSIGQLQTLGKYQMGNDFITPLKFNQLALKLFHYTAVIFYFY